jgi:hypothetical protein
MADDWECEDAAARPGRPPAAPILVTHDARSIAPELASPSVEQRSAKSPRSNGFCWLLLSLGVALFTCGAGLIGYSFLGEREALWDLGTPLVLAGQATFLVGLVLQLDVIWQQSKEANQTLHDLDQRLGPWKEPTAGPLSGAVSVADSIGRIHPADGGVAPPHLALRDLQGRLETVGTQLTGRGGS